MKVTLKIIILDLILFFVAAGTHYFWPHQNSSLPTGMSPKYASLMYSKPDPIASTLFAIRIVVYAHVVVSFVLIVMGLVGGLMFLAKRYLKKDQNQFSIKWLVFLLWGVFGIFGAILLDISTSLALDYFFPWLRIAAQ